jgi:hypothetical protein
MPELGTPVNPGADAAEGKAAGRNKDEVALELMKFIAINTGYGKAGQAGAGFSAKSVSRSPEELADDLLTLFDRCRKAVNKQA